MYGKINKIKDSNNDYIFPVTVAEGVYIDPVTSLKTKLKELNQAIRDSNTKTYVIENERWGIKSDNTDAPGTTKGINNAITWAVSQGYRHVYLTAGRYAMAYNLYGACIQMPSYFHLELDPQASLELVSTSATGYMIVGFKNVKYSKVSGGKIIGDMLNHKFQIDVKWERGGVNPDGSLSTDPNKIRSVIIDRYDSLNAIAASSFRLWKPSGASVALTATGYNFYQYKDSIGTSTFVNYRSDGVFAPTAPTGRGWFDTLDKCNKLIFTVDITATPMTDADIALLTSKIDASGFTHEWGYGVSIEASSYISVDNMEIYNCTGDSVYTGWVAPAVSSSFNVEEHIGHHVFITRNNFHHNRRQGISLCGSNDVYVYDNEIHHIGYDGDIVSSDAKFFTAPAFGIDCESMIGESGLAFKDERTDREQAGPEVNYRVFVLDNYIHHNNRGHLVNPDVTHILVQGNIFEGLNIGGVTSYDRPFAKFVNNTYIGCELQVQGSMFVDGEILRNGSIKLLDPFGATIQNIKMKGGSFYNSAYYGYFGYPSAIDIPTGTFTYTADHKMGNGAKVVFEQWAGKIPTGLDPDKIYYTVNTTAKSFQVSETLGGTPVVITDAGTAGFNISRYNYGRLKISNVYMEVDDLTVTTSNFNIVVAGAVIENIHLRNVGHSIAVPNNYCGRPNVVNNFTAIESLGNLQGSHVSNSTFLRMKKKNLGPEQGLAVANSQYIRTNLRNCLFQNSDIDLGNVLIENCTLLNSNIEKVNNTSVYSTIIRSYLENNTIALTFITGAEVVKIAQCTFNNVTINAGNAVNMFDNTDINTGFKDNVIAAVPATGYHKLGKLYYKSVPTPGGYIGWICTTAGTANNTAWAANTTYGVNTRIYNGSFVYEATNTGKSVGTAPTFPTTINNTVTDNAGLVNWTSKAYVVGDKVLPTVSNGYYYECTTAGTSGGTQPTWTTSGTITDGSVVWTPRAIITWKCIDAKAVFKDFGSISV